MSQFRVEKDHVAASLVLSTGTTRLGCFFVVSSLTTHDGPERVGDLLNSESGFFPFKHDDGTIAQYNRAHLVMLTLPAGVAEDELGSEYSVALRRDVSLVLSTGAVVEGTVLVSGPVGHERLSDYVRSAKQFWYVLTTRGAVVVNKNYIVELVEKGSA